ncbi:hypothetical protein GTZ89_22235 [Streptomyces sp. SID8382]|uniref:hypothetical protein n=1 Tax=Streptomyces malaysiensis TaxID=92644 RepID=UPI000C2CA321|nr:MULTISPECIES: hypothetical protein [unclassified Streptomyces]AUA11256.1 hypothetical protein CFP59_03367 [Streptomyces sp. M56]MYX58307.1 hypothetical protein [Streptomyces sp. SID8382]
MGSRARYHQRPVVAVLFELPLNICQACGATRARAHPVPQDVVRELRQMTSTDELLAPRD